MKQFLDRVFTFKLTIEVPITCAQIIFVPKKCLPLLCFKPHPLAQQAGVLPTELCRLSSNIGQSYLNLVLTRFIVMKEITWKY
jgi:hypothetical protein